jgi:hypothetical protein
MTMREFQVVMAPSDLSGPGDVAIKLFIGEDEQEARDVFGRFSILQVKQVRVLLQPDQQAFNTEEAAEYCRCGVDTIGKWMRKGKLPQAREGVPRFSKAMLDARLAECMTEIEPKAREIKLKTAA